MADTEWWQRGPIDGVPDVLQPAAHILLQVRESVAELVVGLTETEWNARPAGVASVVAMERLDSSPRLSRRSLIAPSAVL